MARPKEKLKAIELRRRGGSLSSIARQLGVSKSSVANWCQEVTLTSAQTKRLRQLQITAGHQGRLAGAEANRQKRLTSIHSQEQQGSKIVGSLSPRDILMLGLGLYWGEGTKTRLSSTAVTNSDPAIILFAKLWFEQSLGIQNEDFSPYIFISEQHRSREKEIKRFWSKLLEIECGKVIFLKGRRRKVYENHDSYYGVLTLRIKKGTETKYRILGLLKACKDAAGVAQLVRAQHS